MNNTWFHAYRVIGLSDETGKEVTARYISTPQKKVAVKL